MMNAKRKQTTLVRGWRYVAIVIVMVTAVGTSLAPAWGQTADEPRTPIASLPYVINQSGSYYLIGNLAMVADQNGITVNANNVTIDLMGFSLNGPGQTFAAMCDGIRIQGHSNVEVRNGTIAGWPNCGVYATDPNWNSHSHRIINVRATANGFAGIWLDGDGHLVKDCACPGSFFGIILGISCTATGNVLGRNQTCIDAGSGCAITANTCSTDPFGYGIVVWEGCSVQNNTISAYFIEAASAEGITVRGDGSLVKNNTIRGMVIGINVGGARNAVEENLVTAADTGIDFAGVDNFYANNRCSGCATCFGQNVPTGPGDGGGNACF